MNTLDQVIESIEEFSSDKSVENLTELLQAWKLDSRTLVDLSDDIERYLGHTWIEDDKVHSRVYQIWSSFKEDFIGSVRGMTMNERLYYAGLVSRFDECKTEPEQSVIYNKLERK